MTDLVIIGAGGHGKETLWNAAEMNEQKHCFRILGFIDENPELWGKRIDDVPVLGGFDWIEENRSPTLRCVCGVGNPIIRKRLNTRIENIGIGFETIIHPSVRMSKYVDLGRDVVLAAGVILTSGITIQEHAYINTGTIISHDAVIHPYVNCAPGCRISGHTELHEGAHLGTGVKVINNITIGEWARIGAGAVVVRDVPPYSVSVGVPAKVIKNRDITF